MKLKTILASIGLGAGLMYFFDPQHGNRRRALVRDKAVHLVNSLDESLETGVDDMRNRARGTLSELTAKFSGEDTPDWILEERVRTALGRTTRHARALEIRSSDGHIHLAGPVLKDERDAILTAAGRTRGVYSVEDEMQVFENPQDIPSLQGSAQRQSEFQQGNWSPATRLLSGVGGSLLALYGLKRKGLTKPLLSTAGLVLTTRSVTNMDTRSLLGIGGEKAIKIRKAINIDAPIDEVYQFWRNFENFELFMEHVKEVSVQGDISTWKVAGPAGTTVEYQSRMTRDVPNESIAWETLPGSQVQHSGFVRFDPSTTGGTRVSVQLDYLPPAGELGHVVAELFGVDPRQAMNEDLIRLKSLLEDRRTSSSKGTAVLKEDVEE
jgi:uncharacterized membrane protein